MIRMDYGVFGVIYCSKYRMFLEQLGYDPFRGERTVPKINLWDSSFSTYPNGLFDLHKMSLC